MLYFIQFSTNFDFFLQVAFSDESSFECGSQCPRRVWNVANSRPYLCQSSNTHRRSWFGGIISYKGAGRLHVCEGYMNQDQYLRVFEHRLLPQLNDWAPEVSTFMQDSSPCHKAKRCMKFLDDNGVEVLPWPRFSPDLNPIETLWAVLKRRLAEHNLPTKEELLSKIVSLWHEGLSLVAIQIESCSRCQLWTYHILMPHSFEHIFSASSYF